MAARLRALQRGLLAALAVVNPLGWTLLGVGVLLVLVARRTGWLEAGVLAAASLITVALALPFLLGRTSVRVDLRLEPIRVTAGASVVGALRVTNVADRPIQIGSHIHLPDVNAGLEFDRAAAEGFRLDIPAGTSVRFEPGVSRTVGIVALRGRRRVPGLQIRTSTANPPERLRP